jgi:hypothetical protein
MEGALQARFEAGWQCFVSTFEVELEARRSRQRVDLAGNQNLRSCVGGGLYTYRGAIEGDVFRAEYRSRSDHGLFEMRRVADSPQR